MGHYKYIYIFLDDPCQSNFAACSGSEFMASHLRLLAQIVRVRKGSTFCMLMLLPLQKCSKQTQWMRFSSVTTLFSHGFYEHFRSFGCLGKATPPKSPKHHQTSSSSRRFQHATRQQSHASSHANLEWNTFMASWDHPMTNGCISTNRQKPLWNGHPNHQIIGKLNEHDDIWLTSGLEFSHNFQTNSDHSDLCSKSLCLWKQAASETDQHDQQPSSLKTW